MNEVDLNNPIFREAMLQVVNRRFLVVGVNMHPIKTDCGDQQCLQLTFVEAPAQHVARSFQPPESKEKIGKIAGEITTKTPIENPTSAPAEKKQLEDIVPPRNLCCQLKPGQFEDSASVWVLGADRAFTKWVVVERRYPCISRLNQYPAPTLEEILREMAKNPRYFNNGYCEIDGDGFIVGAFLPNLGNPGSTLVEYRDKNGATAALKLFLHDRREK